MRLVIPNEIRAEIINDYLGNDRKEISFVGNHKRNAYEDVSSLSQEDGTVKIEISRQGLYDILPEALFHPVDRFDNLPSNEYKERFEDEVDRLRKEEANARAFFSLYDRFVFGLSSAVVGMKQRAYSDSTILTDIICDSFPEEYKSNRFITRAKAFTIRCRSMRGDTAKISLMLRKILAEEGLRLVPSTKLLSIKDVEPRYDCEILQNHENPEPVYLGNRFDESVLSYDVLYWDDECCDDKFLEFVNEIKVFEKFLNDYFMGLENLIHFNISTYTLPVRLSDDKCFNFLDYNTNL